MKFSIDSIQKVTNLRKNDAILFENTVKSQHDMRYRFPKNGTTSVCATTQIRLTQSISNFLRIAENTENADKAENSAFSAFAAFAAVSSFSAIKEHEQLFKFWGILPPTQNFEYTEHTSLVLTTNKMMFMIVGQQKS